MAPTETVAVGAETAAEVISEGPILHIFGSAFTWVMLGVLLLNISQRKIPHSGKKRRATLLWASDFLFLYLLLIFIQYFTLPLWLEWVSLGVCLAVPFILHRVFWPFRLHCRACGKRLSFNQVIGDDDNFCSDCFKEAFPEEAEAMERKSLNTAELKRRDFTKADKVNEVSWDYWYPTETCVLTYILDKEQNRVLLIHKKRGLGEGYINAPGGHIEDTETKTEAARREVMEETGLSVEDLEERGTLYFQFKDGLRMLGYVFFTDKFEGELLEETEETKPFWQDLSNLDYSLMWEDDRLWLPEALDGKHFEGHFIFDDRKMLDGKVSVIEEEEKEPLETLEDSSSGAALA